MTPAIPLAAWVCPRLDLTDPSHSGWLGRPVLPVGGEQGLRLNRVTEAWWPVPCASTAST